MFGRFGSKPVPDIRVIGTQAAQDCASIHADSFAHPWSGAELETLLAGRDVIAEAAMVSGRCGTWLRRQPSLAGFVLSRLVSDEAEILTIAVAPKFRRSGIGAALLGAHLATLAAHGAKALFLEVGAGNHAALALYARFNFHQIGRREAYYRAVDGKTMAALTLRRDFM
jgi:ribosomal-protein-alanine N-acetyltransferase